MTARFKLNLRGLEEVMKGGACAAAVRAEADAIAGRVEQVMVEGIPGDIQIPVEVRDSVTSNMFLNRAKSSVMLAHPSGMAVQAKHGALTKAV
jgi:hypothetical protein